MKYLTCFIFLGLSMTQSFSLPQKIKAPYLAEIEQADKLYEKRESIELAYKALALYQRLLDQHPEDSKVLWRVSMGHYYIGHLLDRRQKRIKHYKEGIATGKKCVSLGSTPPVQCSFWLATNLALLKKENGIFSMAFGIKEIFAHFQKAREIDERYAAAGPHRMLALLYYKAPGFLGGSKTLAYKHIKRTIEIFPHEALNIWQYIKFLDNDGEKQKALKMAREYLNTSKAAATFLESRNADQKIKKYLSENE